MPIAFDQRILAHRGDRAVDRLDVQVRSFDQELHVKTVDQWRNRALALGRTGRSSKCGCDTRPAASSCSPDMAGTCLPG